MREACLRCGGKGVVTYRVGYPGQDQRLIPPAEIRWHDPVEKRCPVCKGTKVAPIKSTYPPPRTEIYWNTPLTDEEMDAMISHHDVPLEAYNDE